MQKLFGAVVTAVLFVAVGVHAQPNPSISNIVRIKFKEQPALFSDGLNEVSSTVGRYVETGISGVDQLNSIYLAHKMVRVFPNGGKFEARHREYGLHLWYDIHVNSNQGIENLVKAYGAIDEVSVSEQVGVFTFDGSAVRISNTNDPRLDEQWHYNNTGQSGGTSGADISLFEAWNVETGDNRVVVSVHDSGIDTFHPDLRNRLWTNDGETPDDGIDNDNNGYIDDYYGYNFAASVVGGDPSSVYDYNGHGTHTSGTIAAENNNGYGVGGVAGGSNANDGVRVMMLRLGDDDGSPYIYNPAPSFVYAADMGSAISSNSWGGGGYNQAIYDAIEYYVAVGGGNALNGGLVIFSSGNSSSSSRDYKADIENVMMVSATNHNDQKAWYSNYGNWVDISAPGGETSISNQGVLSTLPGNSFGFYQGTSMACPHVTGVAALMASKAYGLRLTNSDLFNALTTSADPIDDVNPNYSGLLGSGRVNAQAALEQVGSGSGEGSGELIIDPLAITTEIQDGDSKNYTVRVVNTTATEMTVTIEHESLDWLSVDAVNLTIAAGGVAKFEIGLISSVPGERLTSEIEFTYLSFNDKVTQVMPISMYTLGQPLIYSEDTIQFETLYKGQTQSAQLNLYNLGTSYLHLLTASTQSEMFTVDFLADTLAPGAMTTYAVNFSPTESGLLIDSVLFETNAPSQEKYKVVLVGMGYENDAPQISTISSYDFESTENGSGTFQFEVTNIGEDPLVFSTELNPNALISGENETSDKETPRENQSERDQVEGFGDPVEYILSPVDYERGLAWDGQYLWIKNRYNDVIFKFDVHTQSVIDTIMSQAQDSRALTFDGEFLWEHDYQSRLIKYDLDGNMLGEVSLDRTKGYYSGVAADADGIWMATRSYFIKIDNITGEIIEQFYNTRGRYAYGLASVGSELFVIGSGYLYRIAKGSSSYEDYTRYIAGFSYPSTNDIAFDGHHAWIQLADRDILTKIDLFEDFLTYWDNGNGTLLSGESQTVTVFYNFNHGNGSSYQDMIKISSNSIDNPDLLIPVTATIPGEPEVGLDKGAISFEAYVGHQASDTLVVRNTGYAELTFSASLNGSELDLNVTSGMIKPHGKLDIILSAAFQEAQAYYDTLTIVSNDSSRPSIEVPISVLAHEAPQIGIEESSFEFELFEYQRDSLPIHISNTGKGNLYYYLDFTKIGNLDNSTATLLEKSKVYKGNRPDSSTIDETKGYPAEYIYQSEMIDQSSADEVINSGQSDPVPLDEVLASMNQKYDMVSAEIPNSFLFTDGNTGYYIRDGGSNMYYYGNYLYGYDGRLINYTEGNIYEDSYAFNGGSYFTAKYPGLFVLAADLNNSSTFTIDGNLGSYSGLVDGLTIRMQVGGKSYLGFVKRVYGDNEPSVNHLIIVPETNEASQYFHGYSDYDYHRVSGLSAVDRMYYLLFAGSNGAYIDDSSMISIMENFLGAIGESYTIKTVEPGEEVTDYVLFNAKDMEPGSYEYRLDVKSNDPETPQLTFPLNAVVKQAPVLKPTLDSWDFSDVFVGGLTIKDQWLHNPGSDTLIISSLTTNLEELIVLGLTDSIVPPGGSTFFYAGVVLEEIVERVGTISISSNDPVNPVLEIDVRANGVASSLLSLGDGYIRDTIAISNDMVKDYSMVVNSVGTEDLSYRLIVEPLAGFQQMKEDIAEIIERSGIYEGKLVARYADGDVSAGELINAPDMVADISIGSGGQNVLILASDASSRISEVYQKLLSSGQYGVLSYVNTEYSTIELEDLYPYDAVLTWAGDSYSYDHYQTDILGDVLADYVDNGGGVVTAVYQRDSKAIGGRWQSDFEKYNLFNNISSSEARRYDYNYLSSESNFNHPLLANVDTLYGGYYSIRSSATLDQVSDNAEVVGTWATGEPLIVASTLDEIKRVDLGFYPPSSDSNSRYWSSSTDGLQIIMNALEFVAGGISVSSVDWLNISPMSVEKIESGESVSMNIEANLNGFEEGWNAAKLNFYSNDSRLRTAVGIVEIFVKGEPELKHADTLDLGITSFGFDVEGFLQLNNHGTGSTKVRMVLDSLSEFKMTTSDTLNIARYSSAKVGIKLKPQHAGIYLDTIVIHDVYSGNSTEVVLLAEVTEPGLIHLDSTLISLAVPFKGQLSSQFEISNVGEGDLIFALTGYSPLANATELSANTTEFIEFGYEISKGQTDTRKGHDLHQGIGSDGFGYTYIDSNEADGPIYIWEDIASTGIVVSLNDDDFEGVLIPFEFPLYGNHYDELYITSNGLIGFGQLGNANPVNQQIPHGSAPNAFVAPLWKDLSPNEGGTIHYLASNEELVVQYTDVPDYESSGLFTFQVRLNKSGDILFFYNELSGNLEQGTVGLESASGNQGLQIAFNTEYLKNEFAISIANPGRRIVPEISKGTIAPGESMTVPFVYHALDDKGGYYHEQIQIVSNDTLNTFSAVDVFAMIVADANVSAYRDSIEFDTTYINAVSSQRIWLENESDGILRIDHLVSNSDEMTVLNPSYFARDTLVEGLKEVVINPELGRLWAQFEGLEKAPLRARLYKEVDGSKVLLEELPITAGDTGRYSVNKGIENLQEVLWALGNGELRFDVYTEARLSGYGGSSFNPEGFEVLPGEYSKTLVTLYRPVDAGYDSSAFTVVGNPENQDTFYVSAFGQGIESGAKMSVDMTEIFVELAVPDSTEQVFTVTNVGTDSLFVNFSLTNVQYESNLNPIEFETLSNTNVPLTQFEGSGIEWRAPLQETNTSDGPLSKMIAGNDVAEEGYFYGLNFDNSFTGIGFASLDNPENFTGLVDWYNDFALASEFLMGSTTELIVADVSGYLWIVDLEQGSVQLLSRVLGDTDWTGMTTDPLTGQIYLSSLNGLYSLSSDYNSVEFIGYFGYDLMIGIAMNKEGDMYGYTLHEELLQIDPSTGSASYLGDIGFDANFGQDMAYDAASNEIYMAAFNGYTYLAELRRVDVELGTTEYLGQIGYEGSQMASIAFPLEPVKGFIELDITDATLAPGESVQTKAIIRSEGLKNGKHTADIRVRSNDYSQQRFSIPLTAMVTGNNPQLGYYTEEVEFGFLTIMDTSYQMIEIQNIGGEVLELVLQNDHSSFEHGFEIGDTLRVDVNESVEIPIYFMPVESGVFEYNMTWESNDPDHSSFFINMSGGAERASKELKLGFSSRLVEAYRGEEIGLELVVTSVGEDTVTIGIGKKTEADWIMADSLAMSLAPGDSLYYAIGLSSVGLELGTYESALYLHSDDPYFAETEIPLTLIVQNLPLRSLREFKGGTVAIGESESNLIFNLSEYFADDEGDSLIYTANNTNGRVIPVFDNGNLVIEGASFGMDTLIVTADDNHGAVIPRSFTVMANTRPSLSTSFEGIANRVVQGNFLEYAILDDHFIDADGNRLSYTIQNEDNALTECFIGSNSLLTIKALEVGTAKIQLVASDGYHEFIEEIEIIVEAPLSLSALRNSIAVYPVPMTNELMVKLPKTMISTVTSMSMHDLSGKVVMSLDQPELGGELVIDVEHLDEGVYLLKLSLDDLSNLTFRVIKH